MIYYSSFDPDICYSLLYKQARYPVFLLLDDDSGCKEIPKEQWIKSTWKTYVMLIMEKALFRGVVAAIPLLDESAVKWVSGFVELIYWNSCIHVDFLYTVGVLMEIKRK